MPKLYSQKIIDRCERDFLKGMKYKDIADRYGIKRPDTISKWAEKWEWDKKRERIRLEVGKATESALIESETEICRGEIELAVRIRQSIRAYFDLQDEFEGKDKLTLRDLHRAASTLEKVSHVRQLATNKEGTRERDVVQIHFGGMPAMAVPSAPEHDGLLDDGPDAPERLSILPGLPADGSLLIQPPASATADRDGVGPPENAPGAAPPRVPGLRAGEAENDRGDEPPTTAASA